jgi:UDP-glucose 4-epimerase
MSTYLITGGAGFVGSHLVAMCLRLGHRVICLDDYRAGDPRHLAAWHEHSHFEFLQADVANRAILRPCLDQADIVVHLAAERVLPTNWKAALDNNYCSATGVLEEFAATGRRVLLVSSAEVYRAATECGRQDGPHVSLTPRDVDWGQGVSDIMLECLAREHRATTTVARLFSTIGPRQNPHDGTLVLRLFDQALSGHNLTVPGQGQKKRSYLYVSDVVHWLLLLSQANGVDGQVFDLGSPRLVTDLELAQRIGRITDAPGNIECTDIPGGGGAEHSPAPDISKITALTSYRPRVQLDEALRKIHEWLMGKRRERLRF